MIDDITYWAGNGITFPQEFIWNQVFLLVKTGKIQGEMLQHIGDREPWVIRTGRWGDGNVKFFSNPKYIVQLE